MATLYFEDKVNTFNSFIFFNKWLFLKLISEDLIEKRFKFCYFTCLKFYTVEKISGFLLDPLWLLTLSSPSWIDIKASFLPYLRPLLILARVSLFHKFCNIFNAYFIDYISAIICFRNFSFYDCPLWGLVPLISKSLDFN